MLTLTSLEAMAATMRQITDHLGLGIDPGIFKTVVVLNALGFHTQQSCEGHLDHGKPAPWITILSLDADMPRRKAARLFAQGEQVEQEQGIEAASDLYAEANRLRREAETLHAREKQRLLDYLAAFYSTSRPSYDRTLIVYERTPACSILESQGASILFGEPEIIQIQKLREYQEEMRAFATFLTRSLFEQG